MEESVQREQNKVRVKQNLVGEKFGRLTVLSQANDYVSKKGQHYAMWNCVCECGVQVSVRGDSMKNGISKSCGCYSSDVTAKRNRKHDCNKKGQRTRLYNIWAQMHSRCSHASRWDYKHYGGRGIRICQEWLDFISFKEWAERHGYNDSLTLDRIDPDLNYTPENCRWATNQEQQNNRRNNHYMTYNGETHSMADWARIVNIPYSTLRSRKNNLGWSDEAALSTPVIHKGNRTDRVVTS